MREKTILTLRRTGWVLAKPILLITLGFLIVLVVFVFFKASWVFSFAFFFWLIFSGIYFLYNFYLWRADVYVVTNERLRIKEQIKIFKKEVQEVALDDIVDVTYSVSGFFPTLLNFGTISVQTASSDPIEMVLIDNPEKIQTIILKLKKGTKRKKGGLTRAELIEIISNGKERADYKKNKQRFRHKKIDSLQ